MGSAQAIDLDIKISTACVTADEEWTRLPVKTGPTASLFC
jgi:hypothetical protein